MNRTQRREYREDRFYYAAGWTIILGATVSAFGYLWLLAVYA